MWRRKKVFVEMENGNLVLISFGTPLNRKCKKYIDPLDLGI
jgi:hypothetical protein